MTLNIVKAIDGEDIAAYLVGHLEARCNEIVKLNIDEFAAKYTDDETCVVALIVSPLMLKGLQKSKGAKKIKPALASVKNKLFLYIGCEHGAIGKIKKLKLDTQHGSSAAEHLELKEDADYDTAEIKLRNMVGHAKQEPVTRPSAKKFLVDPVTATEGSVEVKIILLEEDTSYTDITVHIPTLSGNPTPTKLRDGVWMLKLPDIGPGEYELKVTGDDSDLGSARITVAARLDAFVELLQDAVRDNPLELLREMFGLDEQDFDTQLARFLDDGTESKTFFQCVDRILEQGGEKQTCLHFCAKYNLPKLCKRILDRRYSPEMRVAKDVDGNTPLDIAKHLDNTELIRMLTVVDFESSMSAPVPDNGRRKSTTSVQQNERPHRPKQNLFRNQTIGPTSNFKLIKSRQPIYDEIVEPSEAPMSLSAGREHPYNEPQDAITPKLLGPKKENPYDDPWENKNILPGDVRMPAPSGNGNVRDAYKHQPSGKQTNGTRMLQRTSSTDL